MLSMSSKTRKLSPGAGRVKTGTIQVGNDCHGVFISGGDAVHYYFALSSLLNGGTEDPFARAAAESLMELLGESHENR